MEVERAILTNNFHTVTKFAFDRTIFPTLIKFNFQAMNTSLKLTLAVIGKGTYIYKSESRTCMYFVVLFLNKCL